MGKFMTGILVLSVIAVMLLLTQAVGSATREVPDFSDGIVVAGVFNGSMLDVANKINEASLKPEPTIKLIINSPGGSVMMGYAVVSAMELAKARGKKVECVVTFLAASMGFHTFGHCDVRYALDKSLLLYHEAAISGGERMTERDLKREAEQMHIITEELDNYLVRVLGISRELYTHHNEAQTFWTALQFGQVHPAFKLRVLQDVILPKDFPPYTFQ
jgi:ATP-dependent protease ClpP protease subunit